jgi:hypothetical protein
VGPLNTTAGTLAVQPASDDLDVDTSNARVLVEPLEKDRRLSYRYDSRLDNPRAESSQNVHIPYTCMAPEPALEAAETRFRAPHFAHLLSIRVLPCSMVMALRSNASFTSRSVSWRKEMNLSRPIFAR